MKTTLAHQLIGRRSLLGGLLAIPSVIVAQSGPGTCCLTEPTEPLTADETRWLLFMREEEKLARDIYDAMFAKWKLRIFQNIGRSEERHFDAVGAQLVRYGVADPTANAAAGVYKDETLAALYNELFAKGNLSLKDALEVGVAIEKQDIKDLETALSATAKTELKTVYTNLLSGSLNHLEAFESTLEIASR